MPSLKEWLDGVDKHGRQLDTTKVNAYRIIHNLEPICNTNHIGKPMDYSGVTPRFVGLPDLGRDSLRLASMIPPCVDCIIGVARSGVSVASIVAMVTHKPLFILRQSFCDIIDSGHGWRLANQAAGANAVLIDDTVMTGSSFQKNLPIAYSMFKNVITAACYVNPATTWHPDLFVEHLPWPHLLEWNLFNSVFTTSMAVDFDGILCHDCPPECDDDGPKYREWMDRVKPLYPIRNRPIPLIVTARLEKYRSQTETWLMKNGIHAKRIEMGPWGSNRERAMASISQFKASHFVEFSNSRVAVEPPLFVESDAVQAREIARISNGLVVCPSAARCFNGREQ